MNPTVETIVLGPANPPLHGDQRDIWEWSSRWYLNNCITRNTHIPISTSKRQLSEALTLCSGSQSISHHRTLLRVLFITRSWHYITSQGTQSPSNQACVPDYLNGLLNGRLHVLYSQLIKVELAWQVLKPLIDLTKLYLSYPTSLTPERVKSRKR